jgi:hypothetical protein
MADRNGFARLALVAVLSWGCASQNPAPPVPVQGADVSALSGRWTGEYSSTDTGRSGSIVFELRSGDKVAHGDVLMKPKVEATGSTPGSDNPLHGMPQVLDIDFVNATGGTVRGTIVPYRDPACDCMVQTTFVGRVSGDTIEGTFTTNPQNAANVTTGRWKVTRERK